MWKIKPESTEEEVAQNVAFLLSTPKGSVPMMRDLGIDTSLLDDPTPRAKAKLKVEIIRQIKKCEPRVKIEVLKVEQDSEGRLKPVVRWQVKSS